MDNIQLDTSSVVFCMVTGNANLFLATAQPVLSACLSVVSFISVCLIIVVNIKKLKNEKPSSDG